MPKNRVCANNPALPGVTRRLILAAPALALLPGGVVKAQPIKARIQHHAEEIMKLLNEIAPEGKSCIACIVRQNSNPVIFDARADGGMILNPENMIWS